MTGARCTGIWIDVRVCAVTGRAVERDPFVLDIDLLRHRTDSKFRRTANHHSEVRGVTTGRLTRYEISQLSILGQNIAVEY